MWSLIGTLSNSETFERPLNPDRVTVGRGATSAIRLEDPTVSKLHAEILFTSAGKYLVRDLGSTNGTFVNGVAVSEMEVSAPCKLGFGSVTCEIRNKEETSPAPVEVLIPPSEAVSAIAEEREKLRSDFQSLSEKLENERREFQQQLETLKREHEERLRKKQQECDSLNEVVQQLKSAVVSPAARSQETAPAQCDVPTSDGEAKLEPRETPDSPPTPGPASAKELPVNSPGVPDSLATPSDETSDIPKKTRFLDWAEPFADGWMRAGRASIKRVSERTTSFGGGWGVRHAVGLLLFIGLLGCGLCLVARALPQSVFPSLNQVKARGGERGTARVGEENSAVGRDELKAANGTGDTISSAGLPGSAQAAVAEPTAPPSALQPRTSPYFDDHDRNDASLEPRASVLPDLPAIATGESEETEQREEAPEPAALDSTDGGETQAGSDPGTAEKPGKLSLQSESTGAPVLAAQGPSPSGEEPAGEVENTSVEPSATETATSPAAESALDSQDGSAPAAEGEKREAGSIPASIKAGKRGQKFPDLAKADAPAGISRALHHGSPDMAETSIAAQPLRILIFGDSLSLCGFGQRLDQKFRGEAGVESVYTYMACGTNPLSWLKQKPYTSIKTHCGFWSIESSTSQPKELQDIYGMQRGYVPKAHPVPKLEDLLASIEPDILVMQSGTNLFSLFTDGATVQPARDGPALKRYIAPFLSAARKSASLRKIYWVASPTSGRVSTEIQDFVFEQIRACAEGVATVIDSRSLVSFPYHQMEPDREHFTGNDMNQWADRVFAMMKQDMTSDTFPSIPPLAQPPANADMNGVGKKEAGADDASLTVKATLSFKSSPIPLKQLLPYQESLVGFVYDIGSVVDGRYEEGQILVLHPSYIGMKAQPLAKYKVGKTYNLRLHELENTPWHTIKCQDESGRIDLIPYIQVEDDKKFPGAR